ncbi:hypothetical protein DFS33DRAFT_1450060 [Desarmillaria ectypa]|nr:hypothetical protein DFS33DRAFT_1450060 [Desarmillaria ectypa]
MDGILSLDSNPEHRFFTKTLQYLSTTSKKSVNTEPWTIVSYDVEFEKQVDEGSFGKLYKGIRQRKRVAIKDFKTDVSPNAESIHKEIKIWASLQHPNILPIDRISRRKYLGRPLAHSSNEGFLPMAGYGKLRPERPESDLITDAISNIMTLCWRRDPAKRPTAHRVSTMLEYLRVTQQMHRLRLHKRIHGDMKDTLTRIMYSSDADYAMVLPW